MNVCTVSCVLDMHGCMNCPPHTHTKLFCLYDLTPQMQRRRDAEIVRLKKHYLKLFLAESSATDAAVTPKRRRTTTNETDVVSPRRKFRRASLDLWKEACQSAACVYNDEELPSLEEASTLFGYTSDPEKLLALQ